MCGRSIAATDPLQFAPSTPGRVTTLVRPWSKVSAQQGRESVETTMAVIHSLSAKLEASGKEVIALAEESPRFGEWIHLGATSNDILDTATGLQIKASLEILEEKLKKMLALLLDLAMQNRNLVCAGRTHGQIAVPTTYGLRFAICPRFE